jgi:hypothetical protein
MVYPAVVMAVMVGVVGFYGASCITSGREEVYKGD